MVLLAMSKKSSRISCGIAALAILVSANVPAAAQTGWRSGNFPAPNGGLVVFRMMGNNPACASYNGRDCLWGVSSDRIEFNRVQPLVCGSRHKAVWGVTGYENPRHWCNLARRLGRGTYME